MHQDRPDLGVAHIAQHRQQMIEIVAVDRPDIVEAQLLEQRAAGHIGARVLDRPRDRAVERLGQMMRQLFADVAQLQIRMPRAEPGQISRHGADRRRNRHVVVVQDHDQPLVARPGIVHRLVGHARRHRPVADHGDDVVLLAGQIPRHRHAQSGRDRGRGMRRPERVVFALRPLGKARQPAALPQRADAVAPAGQNLVRIGLVPDVPDQPVRRRVEHVVQRHRQFHHAQTRAQMPAGHRHRIDRLLPQLVR